MLSLNFSFCGSYVYFHGIAVKEYLAGEVDSEEFTKVITSTEKFLKRMS